MRTTRGTTRRGASGSLRLPREQRPRSMLKESEKLAEEAKEMENRLNALREALARDKNDRARRSAAASSGSNPTGGGRKPIWKAGSASGSLTKHGQSVSGSASRRGALQTERGGQQNGLGGQQQNGRDGDLGGGSTLYRPNKVWAPSSPIGPDSVGGGVGGGAGGGVGGGRSPRKAVAPLGPPSRPLPKSEQVSTGKDLVSALDVLIPLPAPVVGGGVGSVGSVGSVGGGSLAQGSYDERAAAASFQEAVAEWRNSRKAGGAGAVGAVGAVADTGVGEGVTGSGGSLLEGTYDEQANADSFAAAVAEWRSSRAPHPSTSPAAAAAAPTTAAATTSASAPASASGTSLLQGSYDEQANAASFAAAVAEWRSSHTAKPSTTASTTATATATASTTATASPTTAPLPRSPASRPPPRNYYERLMRKQQEDELAALKAEVEALKKANFLSS